MVIGNGLEFVLALHDNGKDITWDEAMRTYGNRLPTKAQGEVLASQTKAIMAAVESFGGDGYFRFWTRTEHKEGSSLAWYVTMNGGIVGNYYKATTARARAVAPVQPSSAK